MDPKEITKIVTDMQQEHQKVASFAAAETARADRAESALARLAVTKVASSEDLTVKTAALTGRLVITGVLDESAESAFRDRIMQDPSELIGVCTKLASMLSARHSAQADPSAPDEDEVDDGLDPIARFVR